MTPDRRQHADDSWTLKKEFSIGDGIAILVAFLTIVSVYYKVDTRLIVLENHNIERKVYVERLEEKIDRKFVSIDNKLDRLLEAVAVNHGNQQSGMSGMNGGRGK